MVGQHLTALSQTSPVTHFYILTQGHATDSGCHAESCCSTHSMLHNKLVCVHTTQGCERLSHSFGAVWLGIPASSLQEDLKEVGGLYVTTKYTLEQSDSNHIWATYPVMTKSAELQICHTPKGKVGGVPVKHSVHWCLIIYSVIQVFSEATCSFINNWTGTLVYPHGTGQRVLVLTRPHFCQWHIYL